MPTALNQSTTFSWAILLTLIAGVGGGAMWTGSVNTKLEQLVTVNTKLVETMEEGSKDLSELQARVAVLEQRVVALESK